MKLNYYTYRLADTAVADKETTLRQLFSAGELTLLCTMDFDTDKASSTYNHWVCRLEVVSDTLDVPERSMVIYPNTIHFEGDELYTVVITSALDSIGFEDLQNALISIGVPADE